MVFDATQLASVGDFTKLSHYLQLLNNTIDNNTNVNLKVNRAGDTMTGDLTVQKANAVVEADATTGQAGFRVSEASGTRGGMFYDPALNLVYIANTPGVSSLRLKDGGGATDLEYFYGGTAKAVWHVGNDGLNSGLSADRQTYAEQAAASPAIALSTGNINIAMTTTINVTGTYLAHYSVLLEGADASLSPFIAPDIIYSNALGNVLTRQRMYGQYGGVAGNYVRLTGGATLGITTAGQNFTLGVHSLAANAQWTLEEAEIYLIGFVE